jgi:hypothetical protein
MMSPVTRADTLAGSERHRRERGPFCVNFADPPQYSCDAGLFGLGLRPILFT